MLNGMINEIREIIIDISKIKMTLDKINRDLNSNKPDSFKVREAKQAVTVITDIISKYED